MISFIFFMCDLLNYKLMIYVFSLVYIVTAALCIAEVITRIQQI